MHANFRTLLHFCSVPIAWLSLLCAFAQAECYGTPQAAVDAAGRLHLPAPEREGSGYQVLRVENDPLLSRRWAIVARCGHPEWSNLFLPMSVAPLSLRETQPAGLSLRVMVHAGDRVRLWRREALLQIETVAICEQNGTLGERIRVRLQRGSASQFAPEELMAIVQDQSDVEMQP